MPPRPILFTFCLTIFSSGLLFCQENEKLPTRAKPKGHLIIHGGGQLTRDVIQRFRELAGGNDGHVVVVPTSAGGDISVEPDSAPKWIKSLNFRKISILHTRSKEEADTSEFVRSLSDATGIWFSGGRQWRTMDVYLGTKSAEEFHKVYQRGGVIAGSSAGATVQGSYLVRGAPEGNHIMMAKGHEEGFGFLEQTAIDQHAIKRKRLDDMIPVIERFPKLLGISIDEGAALEVHQGVATIIGKSAVAFYNHSTWTNNNDDKKYELLHPGDRFDLKKRRKVND